MKIKTHKILRNGIFAILLSTTIANASAKADCSNALFAANKEYEAGKFKSAIDLISPCLQNNFNRNEAAEAHRLMAICYLILHNQDSAIFHAKHLLLNNPDYNRFPYPDPINLTQILRKIKAVPRLQLGLQFRLNYNNIRPIKNYALSTGTLSYTQKFGFQAGLSLAYTINKNIYLGTGVFYEDLNYKKEFKNNARWNQNYLENLS